MCGDSDPASSCAISALSSSCSRKVGPPEFAEVLSSTTYRFPHSIGQRKKASDVLPGQLLLRGRAAPGEPEPSQLRVDARAGLPSAR